MGVTRPGGSHTPVVATETLNGESDHTAAKTDDSIQRVDTLPTVIVFVSQEPLEGHLNSDTEAAVTEYAEAHDISAGDAVEKLIDAGLTASKPDLSASGEGNLTPAQLESQQQTLARQQRQIVRFQKVTIFGGLGWAVLTFATGANGPVWTAIGMAMIVLMAASTYIWEYLPGFQ